MPDLNINKFLGIRTDSVGDVGLKAGEMARMQNFRITEGNRLQKRTGYSLFSNISAPSPIRGQWYGLLNGKNMHIVAANGKLYYVRSDGTKEEIGAMTDAPTNIFYFNNILYFQNGSQYYKFTGSEITDPGEVNFDSSTYTDPYPESLTLPAGTYNITLGGGKGEDFVLAAPYSPARGGKGGTIRCVLTLADSATVEIAHITNGSTDKRDSYWITVDGTLVAAVGGGGDASADYDAVTGNYAVRNGGAGGGDDGEDGSGTVEGGKGASGGTGGAGGATVNLGFDVGAAGEDGKDFDDATDPGEGGTTGGYSTYGNGGCGYAGGGKGGLTYTAWGERRGSGGGGSSYVDETAVTVLENSQGTNDGAGYAIIQTVRLHTDASSVDGYIPLIYAGGTPAGANATAIEPVNMLTGKRRQQFNGDNATAAYNLAEGGNVSIDKVTVGGVEKTVTTHYTVNATFDTVTFTSGNIPPTGANNVEIWYTHEAAPSTRTEILAYTKARLYGGRNDNRVFLYGGSNRLYYSDFADGNPSAEYFPALNFIDVGSSQHDVTGLTVQYDRMIIHKEQGTYWTQYSYDTTLAMAVFPIYPLNDNIGLSHLGTEQVIENNPYVLYNGQLYEIVASTIRDERNAKYISERIQPLLDTFETGNYLTFDNFNANEYWMVNNGEALVYNYALDAWYSYSFADNIRSICETDQGIVLGTDLGLLLLLDDSLTDNGINIEAEAETGWMDLSHPNLYKYIDFMWLQVLPEINTFADIFYSVDNLGERQLARLDFWSNKEPRALRIKAKIKKFGYIKFYIRNAQPRRLTVLGLSVPYRAVSHVRGD